MHPTTHAAPRPAPGRLRTRLVLLALGGSALVAWATLWWRGRPERCLAAAERALREGDPGAALGELDLPERAPETRDRALLLRARAALARGQPARAVGPLNRIAHDGPLAAEVAFWKGRTLYAARQYLLAAAWFDRARTLRPDDVEARRWLAAAAYDLGATNMAIESLEAVTRLAPGDARAWRTVGLIHRENAAYEKARAAYEKSLERDPDQPRARLELAEILLEINAYPEAERQLESCRSRDEEADRLALLARCLRLRGDRRRLRSVLDEGLAAFPEHAGLIAQRAMLDHSEGRFGEAVRRLDRVLAADPYNSQWLYHRGHALRKLGREAEARRDLEEFERLRETINALAPLQDRAARSPTDAEVRYDLGLRCARLGKFQLAASWFRAALACDPTHPGARQELGDLQARRGVGADRFREALPLR